MDNRQKRAAPASLFTSAAQVQLALIDASAAEPPRPGTCRQSGGDPSPARMRVPAHTGYTGHRERAFSRCRNRCSRVPRGGATGRLVTVQPSRFIVEATCFFRWSISMALDCADEHTEAAIHASMRETPSHGGISSGPLRAISGSPSRARVRMPTQPKHERDHHRTGGRKVTHCDHSRAHGSTGGDADRRSGREAGSHGAASATPATDAGDRERGEHIVATRPVCGRPPAGQPRRPSVAAQRRCGLDGVRPSARESDISARLSRSGLVSRARRWHCIRRLPAFAGARVAAQVAVGFEPLIRPARGALVRAYPRGEQHDEKRNVRAD